MNAGVSSLVSVELDAAELGGPTQIGTLRQISSPSGPLVAFAYDESWLARPDAFVLDPTHGLYGGDQYPRAGSEIAPVFTDASPDRWGRTLLERHAALVARAEGRPRPSLGEWEFLLGVSDVSRMGALRFHDADGRYFADETPSVPPMARLRELEVAAGEIEQPGRRSQSTETRNLALLLAPGSSLGGARPKASFMGADGSLWMAKFPSRDDTYDMAACEWVMNELAAAAGIAVPQHRLLQLGRGHRTFAARRFDRANDSRRLYASAMTMLSKRDREAASYLDLALAIADYGARGAIDDQLHQLFRRVAFNVLTAHRDDHLRNHGFLRSSAGWLLAPAFDLNAMPGKLEHELSIDSDVHAGEVKLVVETAPFYRLSVREAHLIVDEVHDALASWERVAAMGDLGAAEIEILGDAIAS